MSTARYYEAETRILVRKLLDRSDLFTGTQMATLAKMNMVILKALLELMGEVDESDA